MWTKIHLPSALHLIEHGLTHDVLRKLQDIGFHRLPVTGRRLDDRNVAQPAQRHVQRSGNRSRRHGDHIDLGAQLFELLLLSHAETLFFVENNQPEIPKPDVFTKQPVGTHNDVHPPFGQPLDHLFGFCRRRESGEHRGLHGESLESPPKGLEMLIDENRRRRQHRDLLAFENGLECGANRDFGLAVTDVSAQQPIHRSFRFHVVLDVADGAILIRREIKFEGFFELTLPRRIRREAEAPRRMPHRCETQQSRQPSRAPPF